MENEYFKAKNIPIMLRIPTSRASIVLGCVSVSLSTYEIRGPFGKGPGSQDIATLLGSGAAALRADGGELGLPLCSVEMTTEGSE